jgi:hypothetical protein
VGEHPVLDLVPLARAGREVTDVDRHPELDCQMVPKAIKAKRSNNLVSLTASSSALRIAEYSASTNS